MINMYISGNSCHVNHVSQIQIQRSLFTTIRTSQEISKSKNQISLKSTNLQHRNWQGIKADEWQKQHKHRYPCYFLNPQNWKRKPPKISLHKRNRQVYMIRLHNLSSFPLIRPHRIWFTMNTFIPITLFFDEPLINFPWNKHISMFTFCSLTYQKNKKTFCSLIFLNSLSYILIKKIKLN